MSSSIETVRWIHGAPDCAKSIDPSIQTYQYDPDTFIFRISKCYSYEGNFLYLMLGQSRAVLFDSGGPPDNNIAGDLPIRKTVDGVIEARQGARSVPRPELIVAHTHSHRDHVYWDKQFAERPQTRLVGTAPAEVAAFFNLHDWPNGQGALELGDRTLTVIPIPGHESAHIAIYDSATKLLLTGDTLYPGLLTVRDWPNYRDSAARLAKFVSQREISWVLGAHIEMTKRPGELYPISTTYQPDEHGLPLTAAHVQEWHAACEAMAARPHRDIHNDYIIDGA
jgi:glyoxylase-like metal-dependent hydrolase (beta-lactamase superfamily II)